MFAEQFKPIVQRTNETRFLQFLEIKEGVTYGKL